MSESEAKTNREPVAGTTRTPGARRALWVLSVASLLTMSLWFSGTAVLPQVVALWGRGPELGAWLTLAVQLGFVAGALTSAVFNLPDRFSPQRLFAVCALLAAGANAVFIALVANIPVALAMRGLTGFLIAGTYPPAMKLIAGWFREGRGYALGILIGALAVGNAVPHGLNALGLLGGAGWRMPVLGASALAVIASALVAAMVTEGPFAAPSAPFDPEQISESLRNPRLRLANIGYLGHMWELYSLWAWVAVIAARALPQLPQSRVESVSFVTMAVGFVGCALAGAASDKVTGRVQVAQRSRVTIVAMAISGCCCVAAALAFSHAWALAVILPVWGMSVIADSAQFSAVVSEVADPSYVGTALTLQTALGFLLTVVAIRVMPTLAQHWGWPLATASLAVGPLVGSIAMARLARLTR